METQNLQQRKYVYCILSPNQHQYTNMTSSIPTPLFLEHVNGSWEIETITNGAKQKGLLSYGLLPGLEMVRLCWLNS